MISLSLIHCSAIVPAIDVPLLAQRTGGHKLNRRGHGSRWSWMTCAMAGVVSAWYDDIDEKNIYVASDFEPKK